MSISMYEASVGIFVPFLRNVSTLLDCALDYAQTRNIDPNILLQMRLYPNMYNLAQQLGEANRHAVVACALLAGRDPYPLPTGEADLTEHKSRAATAIQFIQSLPRREIDQAADREVTFKFRSGAERKFNGRSLLLSFRAFSSEVDTGSREENASEQESRASVLIQSEPKML